MSILHYVLLALSLTVVSCQRPPQFQFQPTQGSPGDSRPSAASPQSAPQSAPVRPARPARPASVPANPPSGGSASVLGVRVDYNCPERYAVVFFQKLSRNPTNWKKRSKDRDLIDFTKIFLSDLASSRTISPVTSIIAVKTERPRLRFAAMGWCLTMRVSLNAKNVLKFFKISNCKNLTGLFSSLAQIPQERTVPIHFQ